MNFHTIIVIIAVIFGVIGVVLSINFLLKKLEIAIERKHLKNSGVMGELIIDGKDVYCNFFCELTDISSSEKISLRVINLEIESKKELNDE